MSMNSVTDMNDSDNRQWNRYWVLDIRFDLSSCGCFHWCTLVIQDRHQ